MSKPKPSTYKTLNWARYNQGLCNRGSLTMWFDPTMEWYSTAVGQRGRAELFSDEAIQCCLMLKNLFQLPLRQTTGLVGSLLKLLGLNWTVPDYSTLSRRQKHLKVKIPYSRNAQGLHLLVDSTGIKILGEGEWKRKKHGAEYRRQWRKIHLGIDAETLEIRAIEVTTSNIGDAQMLPGLLEQIPQEEPIASISGDGAFDTKCSHQVIAARNVQAVIPVRKNGRPWKEKTVWAAARNEILRSQQRLGKTIWKKWSGYHRRSLVETKMRCFKRLGERLMSRDFERQVTEVHIRAAILNRFTRLGRPTTVAMP